MRHSTRFGFRSSLTFVQMHERLQRAGPWQWTAPKPSTWGKTEMATREIPELDAGVVTLYEFYNRYFDIYLLLEALGDDHAERFARIDAIVRDELLPAIDASDVQQGGATYDHKYVKAYKFECRLTLGAIRDRVRELGPWRWIDRDNDNHGEYISARVMADPDTGIAKIFVETDHFVLNVVLQSYQRDAETRFAGVLSQLFDEMLPALGARVIGETDTYE